jgi:hypothetical protein
MLGGHREGPLTSRLRKFGEGQGRASTARSALRKAPFLHGIREMQQSPSWAVGARKLNDLLPRSGTSALAVAIRLTLSLSPLPGEDNRLGCLLSQSDVVVPAVTDPDPLAPDVLRSQPSPTVAVFV